MEVITYDKSLHERITEYKETFYTEHQSMDQNVLPASRIWSEWGFYLELVIEPVGWQALWKISRSICEELEIHYPTVVFIEVESTDYEELTARVKILAVQDDIHLPETYDAPLIDLYPTKKQENGALDIITTANCIDQLRFFYNNLWMPWDDDSDETIDWVARHLESRLRLYYDLRNGEVPKKTCDIIRTLVREGKDIKEKISRLESDMSDEEEDQLKLLSHEKTCQLMKYHLRLQQIKTEVEVMENPEMRKILEQNYKTIEKGKDLRKREKSEAFFVWLGGSVEETIESLSKARNFLPPNAFMQITNNLQEALDNSQTGDIVIIGNGQHDIRGASGLEDGGIIKGIGTMEQTILCPSETECSLKLLDFSGEEVLIENVSIDLGDLSAGIIARQGCLKIVNCKIFVSNVSIVKLGIIVLSGAKLFLQNTTFCGLGTAIVVHKGGNVTMYDCKFEDCVEGIHMYDEAELIATKCSFCNFKESAIRWETEKCANSSEGKSGSMELLQNVSDVKFIECIFANNIKNDIVIRPHRPVAFANMRIGNT